MSRPSYSLRFVERISAVPAERWDALCGDGYPFGRHAFLAALESGRCVGKAQGWLPSHALLEGDQGELLACAPLYLKSHSWGEFVFDFSWANASSQLGVPYYPKWLLAIPFTPCTGPRVFARDDAHARRLLEAIAGAVDSVGVSSLHALFLDAPAAAAALAIGGLLRNDVQFHWHNRSFTDFADFLSRLSSDKRKKILRERRRVSEAGITFEHRRGDELSEAEWHRVFTLYSNTYEERGQAPYLSLAFFFDYGRMTNTPVRLAIAREGSEMVAVAITVQGVDTLYGRHWGAADHYHSLHFETCYYQGIDYCIQNRIDHFDAGAQGEHKLARGFEPIITQSAHWLAEPRLHDAVADYLRREQQQIEMRRQLLAGHTPFKSTESATGG